MSLSGTHEGGALMFIDAANYSEQNTPANATVPAQGGQAAGHRRRRSTWACGLSLYGRVTTPYPLWDGTNRVLVALPPCEVTRNGVVVSCATLTADEIARLDDDERLTRDSARPTRCRTTCRRRTRSTCSTRAQQTWLIVAAPPPGFMYTDPVALQARAEPNAIDPTSVDADARARRTWR